MKLRIWRLAGVLLLTACGKPDLGPADSTPVVLEPGVPFELRPRSRWPTHEWPRTTPEAAGLDPAALARLDAYVFRRSGDDIDRRGQRTNALLIVRNGAIVYERYARGYDAETPLLTWSVSKVLANAVIGVAVGEGRLALDAPAARYYPPLDHDRHSEIRITDLLRMSSGLDWKETYEGAPFFSSVVAMLYARGSRDMAAFSAAHELVHAPGTWWNYASGDTNLLMAALKGTMSEAEYADYPWRALFDRVGMTSVTWERDRAGTFVGSSYLYATARDLARWGFLMLNDGVWDGQRILPEGWVRYSLTMAPSYYRTQMAPGDRSTNPSAQIYLNLGDPDRGIPQPWPAAPSDTFSASGHWGKGIFVMPSLALIVVRLGDDREYGCDPLEPAVDCVADPEQAFTKHYFLQLVTETIAEAVVP